MTALLADWLSGVFLLNEVEQLKIQLLLVSGSLAVCQEALMSSGDPSGS